MPFEVARRKFPFALLLPQPWPSNKSESELPALIRLVSLLLKSGSVSCVLSARKSPSSETITWPAALRLDLRAFFAVLAAISIFLAANDVWGNLETYLSASKTVASITETNIARKVKGLPQ